MKQGQTINDRYEILRLLGEGGMGNVYLVRDFVENRVIALKLIKEKFFSNKAIDRFKNEFKMVNQLSHPNIIKVYDLDVYKKTDTYFFTMEYVEGKDLTTAYKSLSYREKLEILLQIARGLNYIHNRHIVHFDIKSDNVFLLQDDKGVFQAKIMDFGLANLLEDFSGKVRGTLVYIAPEIMMKKEVDYRADLYSLGMVIYYIFSDRLPFEECKTVKEIVTKKLEESFRKEEQFISIKENFVKNLIKDLCSARKEERIHSAQQLILYLETALEMNIREEEERITAIFNNEFYDKDNLIGNLQDEYLNFCLRKEKRVGMFNIIISENGNGRTQLLETFNVKAQMNRVPSLFITVEKEENLVNIFFRKLIFGFIGFLEKNEKSKNIFILANKLIDSEGFFVQEADLVFKIRNVLKEIFENISTKQSVVLMLDDINYLNETDKELLSYFLNLAVTSPVFLMVTIDIDDLNSSECRLQQYEDTFYLIPPKKYYLENLQEDKVMDYLAFILKTDKKNIDDTIAPYIMKESNGNLFLIKSYLEFLFSHEYLLKKKDKFTFTYPEQITYHSKIVDIYQARFSNLSNNEKFIFLFIAGKYDKGASLDKIKAIFSIKDLDDIISNLLRMNLIDSTVRRGKSYYKIKNENFSKVIKTFSTDDREMFYDKLVDYYVKKKKSSLITYTYCLIKSSAEVKDKKKQLKETIDYCRKNNLNSDRKNLLIFEYKNFKLRNTTRVEILKELYLLLISIGSFEEAFVYYNELLKKLKLDKNSYEYAIILADSVCFSRSKVSLHKKSENLKKSAHILAKSGNFELYLTVLYKRLTFLVRSGRIQVCTNVINHELKRYKNNFDLETKKKLKDMLKYFENANKIQRTEIYLKLVHVYKYLEADFVYPEERADLLLIIILDLIVSKNNQRAMSLIESYLYENILKLNKVNELSLLYIYANLMFKYGKLKKAFKLYSEIEQISVKKTVGNNLLTVLTDKLEVMTNMRKTANKVDNEFDKAITLGKRFKDYLALFRLYTKYINFLISSGRWRDVEINIMFALNLIHKISNKDEIKRFIVTIAYYHYIIKDPSGYFIIIKQITRLNPQIENSTSISKLLKHASMLFSLYGESTVKELFNEFKNVNSRRIRTLFLLKYFNMQMNNGFKENMEQIAERISDLK
ncbi:MAG: protein kinase, partial [Candidatus Delongbacteria bacterium]|nr:protein kinase [Candidatus Delongbacteria bacterium]